MKDPIETSQTQPAKLAGMELGELRSRYRRDLFDVMLPFWDRHGVDREFGGVMHGLDYDGACIRTDKQLWFQGRAIWVYSFLYNHFGRDERHLEIARKTRDFVLARAVQPDGWWAEELSREGKIVRPFQGDVYGMYFMAEGLLEYAWAAKDERARTLALELLRKLHRHIESPGAQMPGTGPGVRPQGLWMVNLRIATQTLARWREPEVEAIAGQAVDAIVNRHYNPDIGLNNENLNHDFSRPKGEETKSLLGHSIETLWMVMDEASRRGDPKLWDLCASRIRRHLEVGWDHVFGGLSQWINVDQGGYVWPVERPVGTDLSFKFVGEFHYMKTLWALTEVLVASLNVFERTRAEWAARFFGMAQDTIDEKFSRRRRGQPGFMLFAGRRMTQQPHVARQDNYHPPRQLMLNLLTLDRMLGTGAGS
ncbi:MAG: AGE family epimerase/isomerase [Bryobacteraceae bacterium]|nr:AGE family epimerase/isomerase [Bryobacteraceae bacterium]